MPTTLRLTWFAIFLAFTQVMGAGVANAESPPAARAIPIDKGDVTNGSTVAQVVVVTFSDLQCPYCRKLAATLDLLRADYPKSEVRFVFKHYPLAFHPLARPAAEAAAAVRKIHGEQAAAAFLTRSYETLANQGSWQDAARAEQLDVAMLEVELATGAPQKRVDGDMALATELGVRGTPATFVNGVLVSGAQPKEKLAAAIDAELAATTELAKNGTPQARLSAERTTQNLAEAAVASAARAALGAAAPKPSGVRNADDDAVWKVPVGTSPSRGPKHALVTLVVFSDFQCPFCRRLVPTLDLLSAKYPSELRVVFKHNPLEFHDRAEPAAQLALEAYVKKGAAGFWAAHDALFARDSRGLEDSDLQDVAKAIGLSPRVTLAALTGHAHARAIELDVALAEAVDATGTPTSFINGKKLSGARPLADFVSLIDAELARAKELQASGVRPAKLYEHFLATGKQKPIAETVSVAAPTAKNPRKGPKNAKVTVQIFTDFECPFCGRAQATLGELEKLYPGKLAFVFRNMALPFHAHARDAHTFAMEAFRQRGATSFWKAHDLLFEHQRDLTRGDLLGYATTLGLDPVEVEKALDEDRFKDLLAKDAKDAADAGITGTPTFVIDGYLVSGAQPLAAFRRVVDHVLGGQQRGN